MSAWQRLIGGRPIVTRLVIAVAGAMAVILVLASGFVYWRVTYALDRQLDQDLKAWHNVVVRSVLAGTQPPGDTPGQTFQVYAATGELVDGDSSLGDLADPEHLLAARAAGATRFDVGRFLPAPGTRVYRIQLDAVQARDGEVVVASAISRAAHDEALRELLLQLGIADLLTLVGASLVGYRTARGALDPVETYRRAAQRAGAERGGRLPVPRGRDDELSRLGHTFNDLLTRIESGATRERQFLADASHELRSPLALISTELEWARHRPRSPAELSVVLESVQGQVARLVDLSNALLEVEELRATTALPREDVSLTTLVAEAIHDGTRADTEVAVQVPDVVVHVNRRWLGIAVANLLRNAERHGGGDIRIEATWEEPKLKVTVRDSGPGFAEDFRAIAFERFTRADRSRTTPGSGLGLPLVAAVARAHGGSVRILAPHEAPGAVILVEVDTRAVGLTGAM